MVYRTIVLAKTKSCFFTNVSTNDLIAIAIQPVEHLDLHNPNFVEQNKECIVCTAKLRPESTPMGLGGMSWKEFFNIFEIVVFTDVYEKGKWPKGWGEHEGTIYWR